MDQGTKNTTDLNKTLIIGQGEVGRALEKILEKFYETQIMDFETITTTNIDVLHICFPWFSQFVEQVEAYQRQFLPKFTVIHSTVPVGTSRKCHALHSPIRGIHPFLEEGIKTFIKFIGGENASQIADYFRRAGIRVILFDSQETTEALKLFDTQYYKECIEFCQRVKRYCDKFNLNFHEVYTLGNQTYNQGYVELGYPEFTRPILQPIMTEIGGHCVLPNEKLLEMSEND